MTFSVLQCYINFKFCICEGTGAEDQRLPRADRLTKLKMQDAGSEGEACHHAADSE